MLGVLDPGMEAWPEVIHEPVERACDDCFFRRAELCAIPGNTPCPTFRPLGGALELPKAVQKERRARERVAAAA